MKNAISVVLWSIALVLAGQRAFAQIVDVNQFKFTVYQQTNAAPPAAPNYPNAYFFGTYLDSDPAYSVANVVVTSPSGVELPLNQYSPTYFENGTPYYDNVTNFETDFPGGTYDYNFNYLDTSSNWVNADVIFDIATNDLFATSIPAFTPDCWTAMQAVDPAQPFTLAWNTYSLTPGADEAYTFIGISDQATGASIIAPSGPPEFTSTNLAAGTFQYGRVYNVSLYFSERQFPLDYGFGDDSITAGWDNLTTATLVTLPLWLQITSAGTNVLLTWPADATSYHLETTPGLSSANTWAAVPNPPTVFGTTNQLILPVSQTSAFFRLATGGN